MYVCMNVCVVQVYLKRYPKIEICIYVVCVYIHTVYMYVCMYVCTCECMNEMVPSGRCSRQRPVCEYACWELCESVPRPCSTPGAHTPATKDVCMYVCMYVCM